MKCPVSSSPEWTSPVIVFPVLFLIPFQVEVERFQDFGGFTLSIAQDCRIADVPVRYGRSEGGWPPLFRKRRCSDTCCVNSLLIKFISSPIVYIQNRLANIHYYTDSSSSLSFYLTKCVPHFLQVSPNAGLYVFFGGKVFGYPLKVVL